MRDKKRSMRNLEIALMTALIVLMLSSTFSVAYASTAPKDDTFGLSYDTNYGARTGYLPSSTEGLEIAYSISTTGVTCTNSSGWVAAVDSLLIAGGSPSDAVLQASVALACTGSGSNQWNIQYGWYDNSGNWQGGYTITSLSTGTYSSLSGNIKIYYTGSCWTEVTYVSQTGNPYSPPNGGCYSSIQGTVASNTHDDWTNDETDKGQVGLTLSTSFVWQIEYPQFFVGGAWQDWNVHTSMYDALYAYADVQPALGTTNPNNIGVALMSTPGVYVQIGQSASGGQSNFWCVSGTCPLVSPLQ